MAYEKTTWSCGDRVTVEAMNNMEEGVSEALACCNGGGGGYLVIKPTHFDGGLLITDTTWQQVYDAMIDGKPYFLGFDTFTVSGAEGDVNNVGIAVLPVVALAYYESSNRYVAQAMTAGNDFTLLRADNSNDYLYYSVGAES